MFELLMDEATEAISGGASGYGTTEQTTATDDKSTKENGSSIPTPPGQKDQEGTKVEDDKGDDKPEQKGAPSGYGEGEKPKEEVKTDTEVVDIKIDLRGLSEDQTKDLIDFAKENKLTNEQAQAILDRRKTQLDEYNKQTSDFEALKKATHAGWVTELQTEWGKDFDTNVKTVNDTLSAHFPETARILANSGSKMNPKQMKEFLSLAQILKDEGQHNSGDASAGTKERHPSDYYNN